MTHSTSKSHESADPDQSNLAQVLSEPRDAAVFPRGVLTQLALDQWVTGTKAREGDASLRKTSPGVSGNGIAQ